MTSYQKLKARVKELENQLMIERENHRSAERIWTVNRNATLIPELKEEGRKKDMEIKELMDRLAECKCKI